MYVTDLNHFLDMSEDAPGPARRLAQHLYDIVRAATAGAPGQPWTSVLPCRRRPGRKPCPGRLVLARGEPDAPIRWRCNACGDDGVISNWADSPYDLRRRRLSAVGDVHTITVDTDTAAALRDLKLLDPDRERLVFAMAAHRDGAAMAASLDDLDALSKAVAAEGNDEPNRRRQRRLIAAFAALISIEGFS